MIAIYGAGAVGLVIGARLARAGCEVLFITRRAEVARRIESSGVTIEDPVSGERWKAAAAAAVGPRAAGHLAAARGGRLGADPVFFCLRTSQNDEAARALASVVPAATVVTAQNGVCEEARLARSFPRVIGAVVRQTCTRTDLNAARTAGAGRLVLGAHPEGSCPEVEHLAARLRGAGYDVGVSSRIAEDKWLKLCINLMSAPNALIRREDHVSPGFVEIKARLLEEAREALAAAGIAARSCDGRDRSLDEEIAYQRGSLAAGTSARRIPLYNQVWAALRHGGPLEADAYHLRILDLARRHGTAAPVNEAMLAVLEEAVREGRGPESCAARDILPPGEPAR